MANYTHVLSSGLFSLPANAKSLDWAVINDAPSTQSIRVTVFRLPPRAAKTAVVPGSVTFDLKPAHSFHNANEVGVGKTFQLGVDYELVVETNDLRVLPSVRAWADSVNTAIAGTLISPGTFVDLTTRAN